MITNYSGIQIKNNTTDIRVRQQCTLRDKTRVLIAVEDVYKQVLQS